jgi:uncharacterized protein YcbX
LQAAERGSDEAGAAKPSLHPIDQAPKDHDMNGRVDKIARFPVKSMLGESPTEATIGESGLAGDRAYALVDDETGKVASAKHPRLWAGLLGLRAAYIDEAASGRPVGIQLGNGTLVRSDDPQDHARLSDAAGRSVRLVASPTADAAYEDEWPDVDGLAPQELINQTL